MAATNSESTFSSSAIAVANTSPATSFEATLSESCCTRIENRTALPAESVNVGTAYRCEHESQEELTMGACALASMHFHTNRKQICHHGVCMHACVAVMMARAFRPKNQACKRCINPFF